MKVTKIKIFRKCSDTHVCPLADSATRFGLKVFAWRTKPTPIFHILRGFSSLHFHTIKFRYIFLFSCFIYYLFWLDRLKHLQPFCRIPMLLRRRRDSLRFQITEPSKPIVFSWLHSPLSLLLISKIGSACVTKCQSLEISTLMQLHRRRKI